MELFLESSSLHRTLTKPLKNHYIQKASPSGPHFVGFRKDRLLIQLVQKPELETLNPKP